MVCLPPDPILFHLFFSCPPNPPCCISTSSYQGVHMILAFLQLTYFAKHNTLQFHPLHCKWQDFIYFDGCIVFHCIYIYHFFIHSSVDEHLGSFHSLAIVDIAAINIQVHMPLQITTFVSLGLNTQ